MQPRVAHLSIYFHYNLRTVFENLSTSDVFRKKIHTHYTRSLHTNDDDVSILPCSVLTRSLVKKLKNTWANIFIFYVCARIHPFLGICDFIILCKSRIVHFLWCFFSGRKGYFYASIQYIYIYLYIHLIRNFMFRMISRTHAHKEQLIR